MIVVDFLLMEHKIHHDHEDAARARALGGRIGVFPRLFHRECRRCDRSLRRLGEVNTNKVVVGGILDLDAFLDALNRVAAGGSALDPEVVASLIQPRRVSDPLAAITKVTLSAMTIAK